MLAICLIAIPLAGTNQEAPKGANLVTFESDSLTDLELFKVCVNLLKEQGYSFDQLDKDFYLCTTKAIKPDRISLEYRIDITVTKNKVQIRSGVRSLDSFTTDYGILKAKTENTWEKGANRSLSTSLWRYGWNKQVDFADKLKRAASGRVDYLTE